MKSSDKIKKIKKATILTQFVLDVAKKDKLIQNS